MERPCINIVSFNVPYPPNYGGIIDVYYKLKTLHQLGVKIILHCFVYERPAAPELAEVCEEVYYYQRRTGLCSNITYLPYNVYSRKDPELLQNLLKNEYPILFEGLHTCYYLNHPKLKKRFKIYRESNIEHDYYSYLARSENSVIKKCFFWIEAFRFKFYQRVIAAADLSLVVSTTDTTYLQKIFPENRIEFMPSFHANDLMTIQPGASDFILYHGKLSVVENEKAVIYLIRNVFCRLSHTCVIAGMDPSKRIYQAAQPYPHIRIEANPSSERMDSLIKNAQIHMLITFQDTGLKLKLLNSLFAGRHIVVNQLMVNGSGLESLCCVADTDEAMISACNSLMDQPFTSGCIEKRESFLLPAYSNERQGKRLYSILSECKPSVT
ncbi:glycosyltransferase family 1 protein [Parabacteroides sp. PF5-9]|uniref:glycosyltransferase family 1 protein n=1 Tax=Parabacteroides sp. PF5-9 TaxID=1742404 RepID=UPI00247512B4|nr:glycosyltransferase family 1 protein [Parabacteroides sp. PF5-9]MDH6359070.1 hypothetical protein [Parabacteroides sp. PF5-9]